MVQSGCQAASSMCRIPHMLQLHVSTTLPAVRARPPSGAYAAQGPMGHTAFDFWTMVYGLKSSVVLMLTRHREGHGMIKVPAPLSCTTNAQNHNVHRDLRLAGVCHSCAALRLFFARALASLSLCKSMNPAQDASMQYKCWIE